MTALLCIKIIDDDKLENVEIFNLIINSTALHPEIIPVIPDRAIIILMDDECKNIKLCKVVITFTCFVLN